MKTKHIIIAIISGILLISLVVYFKFGLAAASTTGVGTAVAATGEMIRRKNKEEKAKSEPTPRIEPIKVEKTIIQTIKEERKVNEQGYYAIVERKLQKNGPGVLKLYFNGNLLGEYECITGGKEANPYNYGGLTPNTKWVMIEDIRSRQHPTSGSNFKFCRIIPFGSKEEWSKRTFEVDKWPFMIHVAGISSGCIAIKQKHWIECQEKLNQAYKSSTFIIEVRNV